MAWQEYGRALVKVRRGAACFCGRDASYRADRNWLSTFERGKSLTATMGVSAGILVGKPGSKSLKVLAEGEALSLRGASLADWGGAAANRLTLADRAGTVLGARNADSVPEAHEECLSFVIPGQQGKSVAGREDGN